MRNVSIAIIALLLLGVAVLRLPAQSELSRIMEQGRRFEVAPMAAAPEWAEGPGRLFRLAWLTDIHLLENDNLARCQEALRCIRQEVKPLAVMVTGDNVAVPPEGTPGETLGLRRHHALRSFLLAGLGKELPTLVIPGDNFYQDFERVFGASQYVATLGGIKFIFAAVDCAGKIDGCAVFEEDTLGWIKSELDSSPEAPVFYVQHEPILPPCFLDAPRLQQLFDATPQLCGVLSGHVHLDMEFRDSHWTQLLAPSIGRSHRPAFKVLDFYADRVVVFSYEWDEGSRRFAQAMKFQRIPIPEGLRGGLRPVDALRPEDIRPRKARPRKEEPALDKRYPQLDQLRKQYMVLFGFKQLLKQ